MGGCVTGSEWKPFIYKMSCYPIELLNVPCCVCSVHTIAFILENEIQEVDIHSLSKNLPHIYYIMHYF